MNHLWEPIAPTTSSSNDADDIANVLASDPKNRIEFVANTIGLNLWQLPLELEDRLMALLSSVLVVASSSSSEQSSAAADVAQSESSSSLSLASVAMHVAATAAMSSTSTAPSSVVNTPLYRHDYESMFDSTSFDSPRSEHPPLLEPESQSQPPHAVSAADAVLAAGLSASLSALLTRLTAREVHATLHHLSRMAREAENQLLETPALDDALCVGGDADSPTTPLSPRSAVQTRDQEAFEIGHSINALCRILYELMNKIERRDVTIKKLKIENEELKKAKFALEEQLLQHHNDELLLQKITNQLDELQFSVHQEQEMQTNDSSSCVELQQHPQQEESPRSATSSLPSTPRSFAPSVGPITPSAIPPLYGDFSAEELSRKPSFRESPRGSPRSSGSGLSLNQMKAQLMMQHQQVQQMQQQQQEQEQQQLPPHLRNDSTDSYTTVDSAHTPTMQQEFDQVFWRENATYVTENPEMMHLQMDPHSYPLPQEREEFRDRDLPSRPKRSSSSASISATTPPVVSSPRSRRLIEADGESALSFAMEQQQVQHSQLQQQQQVNSPPPQQIAGSEPIPINPLSKKSKSFHGALIRKHASVDMSHMPLAVIRKSPNFGASPQPSPLGRNSLQDPFVLKE